MIESNFLRRAGAYASLANAGVFIFLKMGAWLLTGSLSMLTSALDAGIDLITSISTLISVKYAQQPPDLDHRFGHGKAESLGALIQAVFLIGSGVWLIIDSIIRFLSPHQLISLDYGLVVIGLSLISTTVLVFFENYIVKETDSEAIKADRAHYQSDIILNAAIILTLILIQITGWIWIDSAVPLAISIYMIWAAKKIIQRSIVILLDQELSKIDRSRIKEAILAHPLAHKMHDLRTRSGGDRIFIEYHLEIDGHLTIEEGHQIADETERAVQKIFPNAEVMAHQEPHGICDERLDDIVHGRIK